MSDETTLKLGDIYFPVGSARGISQSLEMVSNGDMRRTVNGNLRDLTRTQNRKFESSINASDTESPAVQNLWRGQELVVECIQPFRQSVSPASATATLIRTHVPSTVFGRKADNSIVAVTSVVAFLATFPEPVIMVEFRPILTMLISDISVDKDEYGAIEGWSVDLEEK